MLEAPCLLINLCFEELSNKLSFLVEHMEFGVLIVNGESNAPILWALFVLPLDSSQARSFASMSTLTFGVTPFCAEAQKLDMCLDRAAKLTVWRDSWYSPGFYEQRKENSIRWCCIRGTERQEMIYTASYQASNHQSTACSSKRVLQYPCQFAFSIGYSRLIVVQCINHIWQCK